MPKKEYFTDQYGGVYGAMVVMPIGRLAMPHLAKPSTKFTPRYQATCLFDRKDPEAVRGLEIGCAELQEIADQTWGQGAGADEMVATAVKNGDEKDYQGYAGCNYISASSDLQHRPTVVGPDHKPMDPAQLQAGMKVRFVVTPHTYSQNGGGISWQLNTVMMIEDDGVRFHGGPDPIALLKALSATAVAAEAPVAAAKGKKNPALGSVL